MDFLKKIKQLVKGLELTLKVVDIEPDRMHQAVFNSVAMILELIRKGMTDSDFNAALKAKVANPFQADSLSSGLDDIKSNLTQMATNLRTLQQQLLGPTTNVFEAIKQSKNEIVGLMRSQQQV